MAAAVEMAVAAAAADARNVFESGDDRMGKERERETERGREKSMG